MVHIAATSRYRRARAILSASVAAMTASGRVGFGAALFSTGLVVGVVIAVLWPTSATPLSPRGRTAPAAQTSVQPIGEAPARGGGAGCRAAPLRQRAAQVLVVGIPHVTSPSDALAGELMNLGVGGVFVNRGNVVSADQVRALTAGLQDASELPLLVATDEESGRVSALRAVFGPTSAPRTLAASSTPGQVRTYARNLGEQLADLGVNVDLAPVADLDGGEWSGVIGDRSFSADPETGTEYAHAFADGLTDAGVMPVVKHFPGHGRSSEDVHRRSARVDAPLEELLATDVVPFVSLIDAGAPIVMLGHVAYDALEPDRPASVSAASYRLLRDLGFEGVAMTDSLGMGAVHRRWDFPDAAVEAVRAGADAVLATDGRHATRMVQALVKAVRRGDLDESRLDEAVARMLTLKGVKTDGWTCTPAVPVPRMARGSLLRAGD